MSHRFLNLVLSSTGGLYSVHPLDTSHLFYKSAAAAAAAKKNANKQQESNPCGIREIRRLPASSFNFQSSGSRGCNIIKGADFFGTFGETKILCADSLGQAAIHDTTSHSVQIMPMMNSPKGPIRVVLPIPCTAAHASSNEESFISQCANGNHSESLYVMDMEPNCIVPFEVLSLTSKGWQWRPLPPPPPFHGEPGYQPRCDFGAAVHGNTIFVSPSTDKDNGIGTYSFNTVTQQWLKAGKKLLPFLRKAEYGPGLGHWFGFTPDSPYHFCAVSSLQPPRVRRVWSDFDPPEGWLLFDLYLILMNLGSGRFCIAKGFDASDDDVDTFETCFVFISVEVVRCNDQPGGAQDDHAQVQMYYQP